MSKRLETEVRVWRPGGWFEGGPLRADLGVGPSRLAEFFGEGGERVVIMTAAEAKALDRVVEAARRLKHHAMAGCEMCDAIDALDGIAGYKPDQEKP